MTRQAHLQKYFWLMHLGLILVLLVSTTFAWQLHGFEIAIAAPTAIIYVDDNTCPATGNGSMGSPYCKIQDAVDVANEGSEIHIAAGTYSGVAVRNDPFGYSVTQVVFISKSLTLKGGYNAANWSLPPDPLNNPTIIDAKGQGRGISATGTGGETVILEGLRITGGDYNNKGNPGGVSNAACRTTGSDCGGGLYGKGVTLVGKNLDIFGNYASQESSGRPATGGGVYLYSMQPGTRFENTRIYNNFAPGNLGEGAGMYVEGGFDITLQKCVLQGNQSGEAGGGLYVFQPHDKVTIEDSYFLNNVGQAHGGAVKMHLIFNGAALKIERTVFSGNSANSQGVVIYIIQQGSDHPQAELSNVQMDNNIGINYTQSSLIYLYNIVDLSVQLKHVTAASNTTYRFLHAYTDYDSGDDLTVNASNLLLKGFMQGFAGAQVGNGSLVIQHTNTLADGVTSMHVTLEGTPTFTAVNPLSGDSKLDIAFHLLPGSAAINAGVDAGVSDDIDQEQRSDGQPDIGADEYYQRSYIFLPLVLD